MPPDRPLDRVILWGATGQARVLGEIVTLAGGQVIALFDNDPAVPSPIAGLAVGHGQAAFYKFVAALEDSAGVAALAAIGGARGADRLALLDLFRTAGLATPSAIHPAAWVSPSATLGAGCQILAHATVAVAARLGAACIVNTAASIDHECVLGEGVHIGPGAHLAGCVTVGAGAFVGIGATVLPRLAIGAGAIIGAGAVVTRDVPAGATVAGNPARPFQS